MADSEFDNPKRWQAPKEAAPDMEGTYNAGINSPILLLKFGRVMAIWVHLEESMIELVNLYYSSLSMPT
jgi:hypothetical protein